MDALFKAEKDAVLRGLADNHAVLAGLVSDISEERLHARRGKGFWSIAEHVAHLAEAQTMIEGRVRRILSEDMPTFVPFFPDETAEKPPVPPVADSLVRFKAGREAIMALLDAASDEDWQRRAVHPEYDDYGLRILARHILMHDHWHMYRIEEVWLTRDEYLKK